MEKLGEYLQQVREQKKLGVDQISEKTRINPKYIRALEAERFSEFPGETFAKGFVRSYARSLGLDEHEILKRFKEASRTYYSQTNEEYQEISNHEERERRNKKISSRFFQSAILLFIGVTVWFIYDLNSTPEPRSPLYEDPSRAIEPEAEMDSLGRAFESERTPVPGETVLNSGSGESLPSDPGISPIPGSPMEEISSSVNLPLGMRSRLEIENPLILRIEAVEDTWILAHIDDVETKEVFLRLGETVTWKASDKFLVDFGNAGGVTISLDGKILPVLGESGEVVKGVRFTRE